MTEIMIIPLVIVLLILVKVVSEIDSGAGTPSDEHQQHIARRDRGQAIQQARWREQNDRQRFIWQQRKAAEEAEEDAAEREYNSRWGWNSGKWEWD
jgi:hypothetical protein